MKRANPSSKQDASKAKKAKMSLKQETTQLRPFVFENLPGGVRNQIYELITLNETTSLAKTGNKLTSNSGLMLVNHRISHEFATMLDSSRRIHMTIVNFDFSKFLNFLTTRTGPSFGRITSSILRIKLIVDICPGNCDAEDPDLIRWAAFLRQQKARDTVIWTDYNAVGDEEAMGEWITALDTCILSERCEVVVRDFIDMIVALQIEIRKIVLQGMERDR
ncbi:hypothetical protein HII31_13013 [Pseudocercospora fuligena]|uniref:F-box domain-containing protein n=1 Tax=Pseudocercospora fuligena TaxID=685502 RepID=A0A8H6R8A0_9PEZI|nr:hypothetical protein HII31_13013 [Pseudocercospora fuligena]